MMIEIPDEWAEKFATFDQRFALLVNAGEYGVSRQDVSQCMRWGLGPCTDDPAWRAWGAIRHHAANLGDIQQAALKTADAPQEKA